MNSELRLSPAGLDFIAEQEGFRATVYHDQAGNATIGYGHRLRAGESFPDGITPEEAKALLAADVAVAENAVRVHVEVILTQAQFDALVSFAYNAGVGAFAGSTLVRLLNDGDYGAAGDQFPRWNKIDAGGVLVADEGLTRRREAERTLFFSA